MARFLFTAVAMLSLALFLATCGLWLRSYIAGDCWMWSDGVRVPTAGDSLAWRQEIGSCRGHFCVLSDRSIGALGPMSGWVSSNLVGTNEWLFSRPDASWGFLDLTYSERSTDARSAARPQSPLRTLEMPLASS